jgi:type VI secretion system protein ImpA
LPDEDPFGPDLDLEGDGDYLNFFAQAEGILPASFFSAEDGKPFDRTMVDINGHLVLLKPLLARTRDLRLLIVQGRLQILNKDLAGFAVSVAAVAQLLESSWDHVHPRCPNGDLTARSMAVAALDVPTVIFPLQYAPLFEARRGGAVTYRAWMIAADEVKPRGGEQKFATAALIEARGEADPASLTAAREHVAMLKAAIDRIRRAFAVHGGSPGLDSLQALVVKIQGLIDPAALESDAIAQAGADSTVGPADAVRGNESTPSKAVGAPTSLNEAREALAAIADYYSRREPSSPTLPLVRQAHQLIGKSFIEVISILVPTHLEKAAFQIGGDQVFELPVGKLPSVKSETNGSAQVGEVQPPSALRYEVETRAQAIALLDLIQRYFRHSEPSSPVPMLCERARALAERDFMAVLRDILPKAALKSIGLDK